MTNLCTEDLMKSLEHSSNVEHFLDENRTFFIKQPLKEALESLLKEKGLTRSQVIQNASLNTIYGHQIFSGSRTPSRDKLLAISFGMGLSLQETNTLLKQQGYPQLYAKLERDAVIIYGLLHGIPLLDVNTMLYEHDHDTLI